MDKVIKTENRVNFCGGCNSSVVLDKFIQFDELETKESAWERRGENSNDELFARTKYLGFCLCGNIFKHSTPTPNPPL